MIYIYLMVFVTGGTGLIGSHLLYELAQKGMAVRALRRKESNLDAVKKLFAWYSDKPDELFSRIEWVEGDLLDVFSLSEAMKDVKHVYHCAALVSMNPAHGEKMIRTNVTGTANIAAIALENKVKKFCHVSSVASLGIEKEKHITEETAWNDESNTSAYAISKYLSENEIWRAAQEGLNMVIVNPTIVIGPGNPHRGSGLIFKAANTGLRWYSSGGMGYVDVRDVARSMVALMESDIVNQRLIVTSENMLFKDFLQLVYTSMGKAIPNKNAGKVLLRLAWRLDKFRSMVSGTEHTFTKDVARYAGTSLSYSNKKIRDTLKIEFIPVFRAISDTCKYYNSDPKGWHN